MTVRKADRRSGAGSLERIKTTTALPLGQLPT
jgi:hypothetical protein